MSESTSEYTSNDYRDLILEYISQPSEGAYMSESNFEYLSNNYYHLLNHPEFIIGDTDYIRNACKYLPHSVFDRHLARITIVVQDFLKQFTVKRQINDLWPGMPQANFITALGIFCYAPYFDLTQRYSDLEGFQSPSKSFVFTRAEFEEVVSTQFTLILTQVIESSVPANILATWQVCPGYDRLALLIGRVISNELLTVKPGDKPIAWESPVSLILDDWSRQISALRKAVNPQPWLSTEEQSPSVPTESPAQNQESSSEPGIPLSTEDKNKQFEKELLEKVWSFIRNPS